MMGWRSVLVLAASGTAVCGIATGGAALAAVHGHRGPAVTAAPAWGGTAPLPGLDSLDKGKSAAPEALSCPSAGACVIGGSYTDASGRTQAFVAGEKNGAWGPAGEIPGSAALNTGGNAVVTSVSCPAPGDCAAAGQYSPGGRADGGTDAPAAEAFVAMEHDGRWGRATPLRGLAAKNKGKSAGAAAVSCWAPGDCTVAGTYAPGARGRALITQAFTAGARNGTWGAAVPLTGLAALNTAGQAQVTALSCAPVRRGATGGNCAVGGKYGSAAGTEAFIAQATRGTWAAAREFPGTAARNTAGAAGVSSLSCPAAGDCAAAGSYAYKTARGTESGTGFVADSRDGKWDTPQTVPGTGDVISCGAPGDCEAGGTYFPGRRAGAFTAAETRGRWAGPKSVPGLPGGSGGVGAISCPAAGECGAGGSYSAASAPARGFVAVRHGGRWSGAHQASAAGAGDAAVTLMSCTKALACTAAGYDDSGSGVFVMSTTGR
ncbi:MAG: hypothetical protein FWE35_08350 [Streptosporangiales bacterium]|nr:hypothetical protein [Streptosporangiales bacterium]